MDDTPFGGGPGMVMTPGPWGEALDAVASGAPPGTRLVVPTPAGVPFRQEMAAAYARHDHLVFACGRYEGIDARVIEDARTRLAVDEVSVGDYVLSGGEPAALVMIDAVARLLPGVLGNSESAADDSFGAGRRAHGWPAGGPGLHQAAGLARARRSRRPAVGGSRGPSRAGEGTRRCAAPPPTVPIWWRESTAGALDARDRQVLSEAGFPVWGEDMAH